MYIRKKTAKYKDKTYERYVLVETVMTEKGPRQKTICDLGDLKARPAGEWLALVRKIEGALVGQDELVPESVEDKEIIDKAKMALAARGQSVSEPPSAPQKNEGPVIAVLPDKVSVKEVRPAGHVHVGHAFWSRLGIDRVLDAAGFSDKAKWLTEVMVMNRLVHPGSELAMSDWARETALGDILGVDLATLNEDSLYRNLDRIHPNRHAIETALSENEKSLFNLEDTVFFYDLTSTYFEGQALANPLAQRGYSRDKRPDCKQVVIGLAIGREGFPKGHEVFAGNMTDNKSLKPMLDALDARVGLRPGQTVVVDRGMAFDANLAEIRSRKLHYIVATRQSERDQWLDDFEENADFQGIVREPSPLNPFQKKSKVEVAFRRSGDVTYALCRSEGREEKDRAIREKHEKRFLVDLEKLKRRVEAGKLKSPEAVGEAIGRLRERYPRGARYYQINYDDATKTLRVEHDENKKNKAKLLDGTYVLKTSKSEISAEEVWRTYILLTRAESAFRSMKSPLSERPIFHHLQHRVETHIFLCVLAYHLQVAIENTLLESGVHDSWAMVRDRLLTHSVCSVSLPTPEGDALEIRKDTVPEPEHRRLYDALGVAAKIIDPIKKWVSAKLGF